jgi:hypothetical protein
MISEELSTLPSPSVTPAGYEAAVAERSPILASSACIRRSPQDLNEEFISTATPRSARSSGTRNVKEPAASFSQPLCYGADTLRPRTAGRSEFSDWIKKAMTSGPVSPRTARSSSYGTPKSMPAASSTSQPLVFGKCVLPMTSSSSVSDLDTPATKSKTKVMFQALRSGLAGAPKQSQPKVDHTPAHAKDEATIILELAHECDSGTQLAAYASDPASPRTTPRQQRRQQRKQSELQQQCNRVHMNTPHQHQDPQRVDYFFCPARGRHSEAYATSSRLVNFVQDATPARTTPSSGSGLGPTQISMEVIAEVSVHTSRSSMKGADDAEHFSDYHLPGANPRQPCLRPPPQREQKQQEQQTVSLPMWICGATLMEVTSTPPTATRDARRAEETHTPLALTTSSSSGCDFTSAPTMNVASAMLNTLRHDITGADVAEYFCDDHMPEAMPRQLCQRPPQQPHAQQRQERQSDTLPAHLFVRKLRRLLRRLRPLSATLVSPRMALRP